jgi:hypothetical protein
VEDLGIDSMIILEGIYKKWNGEAWIGLICLRIVQVAGACECHRDAMGSVNCRERLE